MLTVNDEKIPSNGFVEWALVELMAPLINSDDTVKQKVIDAKGIFNVEVKINGISVDFKTLINRFQEEYEKGLEKAAEPKKQEAIEMIIGKLQMMEYTDF
jgi:hypothetical protein